MLIVKPIVIFAFVLGIVPMILLLERKLLGRFQKRYGPNRVGPYGLLQPLADVLKLLSKEQSTPSTARAVDDGHRAGDLDLHRGRDARDHPVRRRRARWGGNFGLYGIDVTIGILYCFAFGSLAFYGLMLGGWASGLEVLVPRRDALGRAADLATRWRSACRCSAW